MKSLYLCVLVALVGLVPVSRAEPVAPSAAPAWKLVGLDGKAISSDQFKGKVVVIDPKTDPRFSHLPGHLFNQRAEFADRATDASDAARRKRLERSK